MFRLFKKKKPSDESIEIEKIAEDKVLLAEEDLVTDSEVDESQNIESLSTEKVPENYQSEQVVEEQAPREELTEIIEEVDEPEVKIQQQTEQAVEQAVEKQVEQERQEQPPEKKGLFQRLKSGLAKTSSNLTEGMSSLVLGKKKIDEDVLEELETRLLMADVGMEATQRIIKDLTQRSSRN